MATPPTTVPAERSKAARARAELLADYDRSNADVAEAVGCSVALVRVVRGQLLAECRIPDRRKPPTGGKSALVEAELQRDKTQSYAGIATVVGCHYTLVSRVASRLLRAGLLALFLGLLTTASPAGAVVSLPVEPQRPGGWNLGYLAPDEHSTSWWWRDQPNGREAVVVTDPPGLGQAVCLGPVDKPQACTLVASGGWRRITADGVLVHARGYLILPLVIKPLAEPEGAGSGRQQERPAAG